MLILSRKVGEKIKIGNNITIVVAAQKNNQIRLGIEAPPEISIYREEIYDRVSAEKREDKEGAQ